MESKEQPLVSVCCLVYNHAPYLRECFEGFVMQKTNFPIEILVHDDASTDGSQEIIKEYTAKYPTLFKPIYQKENQYSKGIGVSVTYQFPRAKGKYIALCEGDDYWTDPYKLQKQVDIMENNQEIIAVATNSSVVDTRGTVISDNRVVVPSNKDGIYSLCDFLRDKHQYPTLTVVFRNNDMDEIVAEMNYLKNPFLGDWILWVILLTKGNFYFKNEVTAAYRINPNSVTHTCNVIKRWELDFELRKKMKAIIPLEAYKYIKNNENTYWHLGMAYRKNKSWGRMWWNFWMAFISSPKSFMRRCSNVILGRE